MGFKACAAQTSDLVVSTPRSQHLQGQVSKSNLWKGSRRTGGVARRRARSRRAQQPAVERLARDDPVATRRSRACKSRGRTEGISTVGQVWKGERRLGARVATGGPALQLTVGEFDAASPRGDSRRAARLTTSSPTRSDRPLRPSPPCLCRRQPFDPADPSLAGFGGILRTASGREAPLIQPAHGGLAPFSPRSSVEPPLGACDRPCPPPPLLQHPPPPTQLSRIGRRPSPRHAARSPRRPAPVSVSLRSSPSAARAGRKLTRPRSTTSAPSRAAILARHDLGARPGHALQAPLPRSWRCPDRR